VTYPQLDPVWFFEFWGDWKSTRRLKTFGHKDPKDKTSPHFLCTRGGTVMHTDPGFVRYALQIQLYNDGFVVHGLEDDLDLMPLFNPGLVILLDTWSPHQVSRDRRLGKAGPNKLLIGIDFLHRPDIDTELPKLVEHIPTLTLPTNGDR
jgi:hypothetical protein